jgi:hypothetical protein
MGTAPASSHFAGGARMKWRWAYPKNWDELARACKERAGWKCEACGIAHRAHVIRYETGEVKRAILCAAHLDHDIWNPHPRLQALCGSCHARYDYSERERARWFALERRRHQWLLKRWQERQQQASRAIPARSERSITHAYESSC